MMKANTASSVEVKTFNQFYMHVTNPSDVHLLGFFNSKQDELYGLYDLFSTKYNKELKFCHTFNGKDFLKYFKSNEKIKFPSIIVFYHDLNVPKNELNFKIFNLINHPNKVHRGIS
jgi:hypothetical protein